MRRPRSRTLLLVVGILLSAAMGLALGTSNAVPFAFVSVPILVYGWLGARIADRAPGNPIGWLLWGASAAASIALLGSSYVRFDQLPASDLPFTGAVQLLTTVLPLPIVGVCFLVVLLLFPEGRPPSARWRPVQWLVILVGALWVLALLGEADLEAAGLSPRWVRTLPFWATLPDVAISLAGVAFILIVVSLFVRSRRVPVDERRPIRGLLVTVVVMAAAIPPFAVVATKYENWLLAFGLSMILVLGVLVAIPFSLSVAMLRYGLFDYEVGIRKTIARRILVVATVLVIGVVLLLVSMSFVGSFLASARGRGGIAQPLVLALGAGLGVLLAILSRWAGGFADRVVFRERATPYEVLAEFSGRVAETYSLDDVLPRMAAVLAGGTGAIVARVWLVVDGEVRPVATHPADAPPPEPIVPAGDGFRTSDPSTHAFAVRHQGELLGALSLTMPTNDPMTAQKEQLVRDVARQAGLVLRNVGLLEDVRESRRRIVSAQDERARKLERDIHDGAQQQLVALTVKLRLAGQLVERDPARLREVLVTLQAEATDALEDLRDLARGIYPPLLADQGLTAALEAHARKSPVPVVLQAEGLGRFPREVESAIYFTCLEALQNVAKYAAASRVTISLEHADGRLSFAVTDDGVGFDPGAAHRGTGLQGIADRMDALGGRLEVRSSPGAGTTLSASVPVG